MTTWQSPLIVCAIIALLLPVGFFLLRKMVRVRPRPVMVAVVVQADGFTVTDRHHKISATVRWNTVTKVTVITTDRGPFVDDMFYHVTYDGGDVTIPSEADGAKAFVEALEALPGFDMEAFSRAIRSTENNSFVVVLRT